MSDEDLVRRLRGTTQHLASSTYVDMTLWESHSSACFDAADAIERLTREIEQIVERESKTVDVGFALQARADAAERKVEKLREALKPFAAICDAHEIPEGESGEIETFADCADLLRARAALAEPEKTDD